MYPRPVLDQLLAAFSKRLRNLIPPEAAAGRWTSDVFCVILPNPLIRSICSEVAKSCGGRYACVSDGSAVSIHIQMAVTALSRREHEDVYELIKRLDLLRPEA
jgi:GGDEF domain-containing protein